MANLVELSNQLEDFPEQQLVQMSQDPNSMYPSYLVLSEIQRRNQMRKMYEAQQPKPQTTVAEEVIGEFAGQQGLQGAMAQSPGPQDAFPPSDMGNMAPPSPMQMMAGGGRTELTSDTFTPTAENPYPTAYSTGSELTSDTFTPTAENPYPTAYSTGTEDISNEELEQILEARKTFPRNEDGSIDKSAVAKAVASGLLTATAAAALIFPEPTTSALGAARLGTTAFGKNLLQLPGKIKSGVQSYMGKRALSKDPIKRFGPEDAKGLKPLQTTNQIGSQAIKDLKIPTRGAGLVGLSVAGNMINDGVEEPTIEPKIEPTIDPNTTNTTDITAKEIVSDDVETGRRGLANFLPNADPTALIGLGGAIMGANTIGELGKGISEVALGERARKDALSLNDLKNRLTEAQINKYEADIANMPLDIAIKQYQSLNDLVDSGVLTADEAKLREVALMERIQRLQGITVAEKSKRDELLGLVKEVG